MSTPSLLTLDNEEASISVGQQVPFITGSTTSSSNSNPFQTIKRESIGVKLKITPQINEGNAIRLKIEQEVSKIDKTANAADIVTGERKINTTVLVDDGQIIVLGGLIDDVVIESESKVPFLGDIPLLGSLFRFNASEKSKRNLMVFLKPSIVRENNKLAELSSEKYNFIRAEQIKRQTEGEIYDLSDYQLKLPTWDESLALPPSYEASETDGTETTTESSNEAAE